VYKRQLLVIVVDGSTPELADRGAAALAQRLAAEPQLFKTVERPDGGEFFDRNGLLFLDAEQVRKTAQGLIEAQPLIGGLAHDPSLRGLFGVVTTFADAAARGQVAIDRIDAGLVALGDTVRELLDGRPASLSWQQMLSRKPPEARELRRLILTQPALDYDALEPAGRARAEVRRLAGELGLDPASGIRVRMTGSVAIDDEQFATLRQGALLSTILSIVAVSLILFLALRSLRLAGAIMLTVATGLVLTAGFAAVAIGSLNLISVAFAVLFVGLATDFGIQFGIRYRDRRQRHGDFVASLRAAAASIGGALGLAAAATAIGFLAFLPTEYAGIAELGLIAGIGMLIGIALTFTLLPALLALLRPRGEPEPVGWHHAAPIDRLLAARRKAVLVGAGLLAAGGLALLPLVSFDFDPLDLNNPHGEAMSTLFDLMRDPTTNPYGAEALAPSVAAAQTLAERLSQLPEVAEVVTIASFIPEDQKEKLAALADLSVLLGPTLTPPSTLPPPGDDEAMRAIAACAAALAKGAARDPAAARLAAALDEAGGRGTAVLPALQRALTAGLAHELDMLRQLLTAAPVSLASLPADLRRDWLTPDGQARLEIFPRGNARDHQVLRHFVEAISQIDPEVTGNPVTIQESGRTITGAFTEAGVIAFVAISLLLALVLHRARDVAFVLAPLLLSAILTLATTVVIGLPLNYANIIALPLLLGIGVAFDIYFVMQWRAGISEHLQSSTARAVVFSALTTMSAFGSLALSHHPGTADMGKLLTLSLAWTLFCTLFVLPALLGPSPTRPTPFDLPRPGEGLDEPAQPARAPAPEPAAAVPPAGAP